ncbi:MAG: cytochrome, partial [Alphaproteobacteria bacterium PA4]
AEPGAALAALFARAWDAQGRASPWRLVTAPARIAGVAVAPGCWVLAEAPGLAAAAGPVSLPDGAADRLGLAVLTGLFRPLLQQPDLRPQRRPRRIGHYLSDLPLRFRAAGAEKHVGFIVVPIAPGSDPAAVQAAAAALGHPAVPAVAQRLDGTGIVHFASLAVVDSDRPALILELTVDGAFAAALAAVAAALEPELRAVLAAAGHAPAAGPAALAAVLADHVVRLHGKPWGATGLSFHGLPQLSVARIRAARALAARARALLDAELATSIGQGSRAMALLGRVRQALRAEADPALAAALLVPASRPLALAAFRQPDRWPAFRRFLISADALPLTLPLLLLWIAAGTGLWRLWAPAIAGHWFWLAFIATIGGALVALVALILLFIATRWALNALEARDPVDTSAAGLNRVRAIAAVEDHPGYSQNHIFAWGTLKPGLFRVGLHALALWLIGMICKYYYRPGFVLTMGTIHAANWWRIPGTRTMAFHANYDGSWDSYLEDFITRVPSGQTGAWSNWVGFPRTRDLIDEGARDGDRFKRWVRLQQRPAAFWYTAFQRQSAEQIRSDALIQHGLALAACDSEARDWLRLFGSRPRGADTIESDEVQSLVFEGLKRLPVSTTLGLALPRRRRDLALWQQALLGIDADAALAAEHRLRFGDTYADAETAGSAAHATFLALSAAGFAHVRDCLADASDGQRAWAVPELLDSFPPAFRLGMAGRARVLGDQGGAGWRWADGSGDAAVHGTPEVAEAVLLLYASDAAGLDRAIAAHRALLDQYGGAVRNRRDSWHSPVEHFGFRDGISQPVIRGTARHNGGMPDRDVVEPGEFLLGYASNQGYRPLGPLLRGEIDGDHILPVAEPGALTGVPDFGTIDSPNAARDFGRNGSFLVIRELEQHVDSFNAELAAQAAQLNRHYAGLDRVIGQAVTPDWLAAKLMGRWRDGRPLVGNPLPEPTSAPSALNDFAYGIDDPEGLACPFAAHIRRTNPRDSKNPGNALEQVITNRHRLLRRGRSYGPQDGPGERGMMFLALCANLERQFEFVQQTWMNAPTFHGLDSEPDAFAGQVDAGHGPRCFTIPTAAGPVRLHGLASHVTPRGGGYFFLPGRSALIFLARTLG